MIRFNGVEFNATHATQNSRAKLKNALADLAFAARQYCLKNGLSFDPYKGQDQFLFWESIKPYAYNRRALKLAVDTYTEIINATPANAENVFRWAYKNISVIHEQ